MKVKLWRDLCILEEKAHKEISWRLRNFSNKRKKMRFLSSCCSQSIILKWLRPTRGSEPCELWKVELFLSSQSNFQQKEQSSHELFDRLSRFKRINKGSKSRPSRPVARSSSRRRQSFSKTPHGHPFHWWLQRSKIRLQWGNEISQRRRSLSPLLHSNNDLK